MSEPRYRLQAYVCADGCVRFFRQDGWMTFGQVFVLNPEGCRFAIVEAEPERFVVFDMWETQWKKVRGHFVPTPVPVVYREFPTLDAAIAACSLIY